MSAILAFDGHTGYVADYEIGGGTACVAVPCLFGESSTPTLAMLDTASKFTVIPADLAPHVGLDTSSSSADISLSTRFGSFDGYLVRLDIEFCADAGEPIRTDCAAVVCPNWPSGPVIGWKGCLEGLRFGLDPQINRFYFAHYAE